MVKWCCRVLGGRSIGFRAREREYFDRGSFVIHFLLMVPKLENFQPLSPWEVRIAEFNNALLRLPAVFRQTFEASSTIEAFHDFHPSS